MSLFVLGTLNSLVEVTDNLISPSKDRKSLSFNHSKEEECLLCAYSASRGSHTGQKRANGLCFLAVCPSSGSTTRNLCSFQKYSSVLQQVVQEKNYRLLSARLSAMPRPLTASRRGLGSGTREPVSILQSCHHHGPSAPLGCLLQGEPRPAQPCGGREKKKEAEHFQRFFR